MAQQHRGKTGPGGLLMGLMVSRSCPAQPRARHCGGRTRALPPCLLQSAPRPKGSGNKSTVIRVKAGDNANIGGHTGNNTDSARGSNSDYDGSIGNDRGTDAAGSGNNERGNDRGNIFRTNNPDSGKPGKKRGRPKGSSNVSKLASSLKEEEVRKILIQLHSLPPAFLKDPVLSQIWTIPEEEIFTISEPLTECLNALPIQWLELIKKSLVLSNPIALVWAIIAVYGGRVAITKQYITQGIQTPTPNAERQSTTIYSEGSRTTEYYPGNGKFASSSAASGYNGS